MIEVALVCVGTQYDPEVYVHNIKLGLQKHLSASHRITVLTDNTDHPYYSKNNIRTIGLPDWGDRMIHHKMAWWFKMCLFNRDNAWTDQVFYIDLDCVIINSIDKFILHNPDGFNILQDFNRRWRPDYPVSNSSIMKWYPPKYYDIWRDFDKDKENIFKSCRGDQDYITKWFCDRTELSWWPKEWAMSFKWEIYMGGLKHAGTGLTKRGLFPIPDEREYETPHIIYNVNPECSIVVFHGVPLPYTNSSKQPSYGHDLAPYIKQLSTQPI